MRIVPFKGRGCIPLWLRLADALIAPFGRIVIMVGEYDYLDLGDGMTLAKPRGPRRVTIGRRTMLQAGDLIHD